MSQFHIRTFENKYNEITDLYNRRNNILPSTINFNNIMRDLSILFPKYSRSNPVFLALAYFYLNHLDSYDLIYEEYLKDNNIVSNKITFNRYFRLLSKNDPFRQLEESIIN